MVIKYTFLTAFSDPFYRCPSHAFKCRCHFGHCSCWNTSHLSSSLPSVPHNGPSFTITWIFSLLPSWYKIRTDWAGSALRTLIVELYRAVHLCGSICFNCDSLCIYSGVPMICRSSVLDLLRGDVCVALLACHAGVLPGLWHHHCAAGAQCVQLMFYSSVFVSPLPLYTLYVLLFLSLAF